MGVGFLRGQVTQLFGMEGLLNHAPLHAAAIPYPRSRVVAGGGAKDHFDWFKVQGPRAPRLQGGSSRVTRVLPVMSHDKSSHFGVMFRPEPRTVF